MSQPGSMRTAVHLTCLKNMWQKRTQSDGVPGNSGGRCPSAVSVRHIRHILIYMVTFWRNT